jgi:hypothetical protein
MIMQQNVTSQTGRQVNLYIRFLEVLQIGAKGALGKIVCGCGKIPLFEHDRDFSI